MVHRIAFLLKRSGGQPTIERFLDCRILCRTFHSLNEDRRAEFQRFQTLRMVPVESRENWDDVKMSGTQLGGTLKTPPPWQEER